MQPNQSEIIILKPTKVFLSFLQSQLPDVVLPSLKLLNTDNTAYVIKKQPDDEATLDEIEKHFSTMFRYEIARWLGPDAYNEIEGSFLDFLCCFKFELHSHMVVLEDSLRVSENMLRIRPRSVLLKWMQSAVEEPELVEVLETVDIAQLAENATVVLKNFKTMSEIKPFLEVCYSAIFEAEMYRMSDDENSWPKVESFKDFSRYFAVDIHTHVVHL